MAKITHVHIGLRRLYQHPYISFENFTIESGMTIELEPGDTPVEAAKKSFPILREQMIDLYKEFKPKPPKSR